VHPEFCAYLIVVGWQLIEKLFDSVFLSRAVNVRDLLLWQAGEIQLDLMGRNAEFRPRDTLVALPAPFSYRCISSLIYEGRPFHCIRPMTGFVRKIREPDEPAQQT